MGPQPKKPQSQTLNHFWPRLSSTVKPLGSEARKTKCAPVGGSSLPSVDSRIFVQGGEWVLNNLASLKVGTEVLSSTTCVLLLKESPLFQSISPARTGTMVQGILHTFDAGSGDCEFAIFDESHTQKAGRKAKSSARNKASKLVDTTLSNEDIWWCIPFWVAADYKLHHEKIPVEKGFYFLVEPGQAFCVVAINWSSPELFVKAKVDESWCSLAAWLLDGREKDAEGVIFDMFEEEGEAADDATKGQRLCFMRREKVERPAKNWQTELGLSGTVSMLVWEACKREGSDSEADLTSDEEDNEAHASTSRKVCPKTEPCSQESEPQESGPKRGAVVKLDSKWALHLALAPTGGDEVTTSYYPADQKCGRLLGTQALRYRASDWFETIDLVLQEERMRIARLEREGGIIVGEAWPEGGTKDKAIAVEDEPAAAAALPGVTQGGPVQGGPIRTKHLKVNFHEEGRGSPVSHTFPVAKTRSIPVFKESVKDVLAGEDFYGEDIRTTRLKWTYLDGDGCELDMSPFTEASELEASTALHVYTLPRKAEMN